MTKMTAERFLNADRTPNGDAAEPSRLMIVNAVANESLQRIIVVPNHQRGLEVTVDKWTSVVAVVP